MSIGKEVIENIVNLISNNQQLPIEYKNLLFPPEKKECELVYHQKERDVDILANTLTIPLQQVKHFGNNKNKLEANKLIFGDNLQALKSVLRLKEEGKIINPDGSHGIKLIYIDPPFATQEEMRSTQGELAYQDKVHGAEFVELIRKRLVLLRELLSSDGTIYVHLDARKAHYIKIILDEIFPSFDFSEIIWVCGLMGAGKFYPKAHETIYCYKSKGAYFNPPARVGYSTRITKALQRDEDGWFYTRGKESSGGKNFLKTYISSDPKLSKKEAIENANRERPQPAWSVWIGKRELAAKYNDFPVGTYAYTKVENVGFPTQKPEALLGRIISASSDVGDWVLDCFAGSGTTLAVAEKLNRKWIGIDSSKYSIYTIQKRFVNLKDKIGNRGKKLKPKPFILYNSGFYDYSKLKDLDWNNWRQFALTLFQCQDENHKIGGIKFDGYRDNSDVILFDHTKSPDVVLDYGFIDDLYSNIRNKAKETVFIIAPAASVAFLEDYVDRKRIRFYILRIPYSIINEIHNRDFEVMHQPNKVEQVNEFIDSFGFDFKRLPNVECKYTITKRENELFDCATINIEHFKSNAMIHGFDQESRRDNLSMVMVDMNYDGDVFVFDKVFFSNEIEEDNWKIYLPIESLGKNVMIIYFDIFGNEYREIRKKSDFLREQDD